MRHTAKPFNEEEAEFVLQNQSLFERLLFGNETTIWCNGKTKKYKKGDIYK